MNFDTDHIEENILNLQTVEKSNQKLSSKLDEPNELGGSKLAMWFDTNLLNFFSNSKVQSILRNACSQIHTTQIGCLCVTQNPILLF